MDTAPIKENVAACKGEECPKCGSKDVKYVGCNPDGRNVNAAYDCQNPECLYQWEGY